MNWEQKTKMIQSGNNEDCGQVIKIMLECLPDVDEQGYDMFVNSIELTHNKLKSHLLNHQKIIQSAREMKFNSLRAAVRWSYYEKLIEELTNHTPPPRRDK